MPPDRGSLGGTQCDCLDPGKLRLANGVQKDNLRKESVPVQLSEIRPPALASGFIVGIASRGRSRSCFRLSYITGDRTERV
jgi:hypothetical protein